MNKKIWAALLALVLMLGCASAMADFGSAAESMNVTFTLSATDYEDNLFQYELTFPATVQLTRSGDTSTYSNSVYYEFGVTNIQAGASGIANALTCPWVKFRVTPTTKLTCGDKAITCGVYNVTRAGSLVSERLFSAFDVEYTADDFANAVASGTKKLVHEFQVQALWTEANAPEFGDIYSGQITYYGVLVQ